MLCCLLFIQEIDSVHTLCLVMKLMPRNCELLQKIIFIDSFREGKGKCPCPSSSSKQRHLLGWWDLDTVGGHEILHPKLSRDMVKQSPFKRACPQLFQPMTCRSDSSPRLGADFCSTIPWCSHGSGAMRITKSNQVGLPAPKILIFDKGDLKHRETKTFIAPWAGEQEEFFTEEITLEPNLERRVKFTRESQGWRTSQAEERAWPRAGRCETTRQIQRAKANLS